MRSECLASVGEPGGLPWTVLPERVAVSSADVETLRGVLRRSGTRVFNPDAKRSQAPLPSSNRLCARIRRVAHRLCQGRTMVDAVVLQSRPGCKRQQWHCDFDPESVAKATVKPLGVLVALERRGAHMHFLHGDDEHVVQLKRGEILVFDGDAVHAGGSYTRENLRLHAYLDSAEVRRRRNSTYIYGGDR